MALMRFAFGEQAWSAGAHPLERKKLVGGERAVALLEFAPGFEDPNLCERAHVIYVVSGELELALDERVERLRAGDGCTIERGTRHRARNASAAPVTLFIVSD